MGISTPTFIPTNYMSSGTVWCPKIYINNNISDISTPLAGFFASVFHSGLYFTETIACSSAVPLLWNDHYAIIQKRATQYFIDNTSLPSNNELKRQIEILAHRNKYPKYSRMHIIVWLNDDTYTIEHAIIQERVEHHPYEYDTTKRIGGIYAHEPLPDSAASQINRAAFCTFAQRWARNNNYTTAIIVNPDGTLANTTYGNIILVMHQKIITTTYGYGRLQDALTPIVEQTAREMRYSIEEVNGIQPELLKECKECFTVNAAEGIKGFVGVNDYRFYTDVAKQLSKNMMNHIN